MKRRDKTNYYLDIATVVLERGTCLRRNYGAIIVKNDEIISTGYTGAPRGRKNCMDLGFCRRNALNIPRGQRYELCRSVHAEENAIISMYAKTKGVRKVVTMIRTMSYVDFFRGVGLQSIVSPRTSTASYILRYVRSLANADSSHIETLHKFLSDRVAAMEFRVKEPIQGLTDIPLKDLKCKKGILIACIGRKDKVIIPTGNDVISNGDTVIVVTAKHHPEGLGDILES